MSTLSVTGKLYSGTPTVQKTEKFAVRTFALELSENVNGQVYTNHVQFQLTNTKCQLLDAFAPGQIVTVHFNLRGTIWNDKVITNLEAWKIELAPMAQAQPAPQYQQPAYLQQPLGQPAQPAYAQQQPQYAPQPQATPAPQPQQWPPVQQQQMAPPPQQPVPQSQQWGGVQQPAPQPQQGLPF